MDYRLKVFAVAASTLNFSKASEILGISQPAITKHVQGMEKEYGVKLFSRRGAKLSLTYQGEIFLKRSREILEQYKELEYDSKMLANVCSGKIRVGVPSQLMNTVMPSLFADFCRLSPDVVLSPVESESSIIHNEIRLKHLDVGFSSDSKHSHRPFFKDRLIIAGIEANGRRQDYRLSELRFVSYKGDAFTESIIDEALASCNMSREQLNRIISFDTPSAAFNFMLQYGADSKEDPLPVCSFLWAGMIAAHNAGESLQAIKCSDFQFNSSAVSVEYGVEDPGVRGLGEYSEMWGSRLQRKIDEILRGCNFKES